MPKAPAPAKPKNVPIKWEHPAPKSTPKTPPAPPVKIVKQTGK